MFIIQCEIHCVQSSLGLFSPFKFHMKIIAAMAVSKMLLAVGFRWSVSPKILLRVLILMGSMTQMSSIRIVGSKSVIILSFHGQQKSLWNPSRFDPADLHRSASIWGCGFHGGTERVAHPLCLWWHCWYLEQGASGGQDQCGHRGRCGFCIFFPALDRMKRGFSMELDMGFNGFLNGFNRISMGFDAMSTG